MKHAKATKTEVQTVMNRLSDKKKAEELKTQFYEDSVYATCIKTFEAYGEDEGLDKALDFLSGLFKSNMISGEFYAHTAVLMILESALNDMEEGDDNG